MPEYSAIWINASYNSEFRIRKTTKTNKPRRFPCSLGLQTLLREMDALPHTELLFTHYIRGSYMSGHTFAKAVWRKVLQPLIDTGAVERYRVPYNTRHTWATMALESGMTIAEVARYMGSSPTVVQTYYFGVSRDRPMPDF